MKPPELWSLLVFIAGVTIGTIGTILAIVFGLENSKTHQCVCNGANVELFSVRTEIQPSFMSWDERFENISSTQYQAAARNISQTLTAALMANDVTQISSYAAFSNKTMASVQVARLSEGKNNSIVSLAYGVVYGDESSASLPSYADIQSKLDSDTKVVSNATVDSVSSPGTDPCAYQLPASTMGPKTTFRTGTTPKNLLPSSSTGMSQSSHSTILPTTSPTTHLGSTSTRRPTAATSPAVTEILRNSTSPHSTMPSRGTSSIPSSSSVSSSGHSTLPNATLTPPTVTPAWNFTSSTYPPSTTGRTTLSTTNSILTSHTMTTATAVHTQPTSKPHTTQDQSPSSSPPAFSTEATSTPLQTVTSTTTAVPTHSSSPTTSQRSTSHSTTTQPYTSTFPTASTGTGTLSTSTSAPIRSTRASTHEPSSHPSTSFSTATPSISSSTVTPSTSPVTSSTPPTSTSLMPSISPSTTATTTSPTLPPTTLPCLGGRKYKGDIAVAFELTTNTNSAAVESFVNTLLTYSNNPYSFTSDDNNQEAPSAYILVPYPNTEHYNPQNMYGRLRETDLNVSLSTFNILLSLQPQFNATIDEAFDFIHGVKQRSSVRSVVLVGVSDAFVQAAQQSAKQLAEDGYNIFTVSIGVADFSSLATNKSFVHVLVSPSSSVEATMIASEIGTTLVQESSVCFPTAQSTMTTAAPAARSTTGRPYSTTSACKTTLIQQDIAFVVEISTSTGNLEASHAASIFITQYLIQQSLFDDHYSNFAIVPFPNASSYTVGGGVQDFGHLLKADFPLVFQMIFSVYPITSGAVSDIESGLRYAMEFEFPRLHDVNPRTILLFANSDDGVQAALEVSSDLKAKDVHILTVRMSDSDDLSLQPLSSAPDYNWSLHVSDASSYSLMAEWIWEASVLRSHSCELSMGHGSLPHEPKKIQFADM